jgi:hypothetical protein
VIHSSKIIYYFELWKIKKEAVTSRLGFVVTEEGVAYNKKGSIVGYKIPEGIADLLLS